MLTISTVLGVFITSALIGIINTALESKLSDLRRGKSKVLEEGHVVILGFNDDTFSIISELIIANDNQKNACIVVMGSAEKEEMEEKIASLFGDTKTTNIICRSGQIYDFSDLARCSIETCRSIIINEKDDFEVIKAILAVSNLLKNAKIKNPDAYEIYMEDIPALYGKAMSEIIMSFEKPSVIGLIKNGVCMLNPGMDAQYEEGDKVVLIAEDDGVTVPLEKKANAQKSLMVMNKVGLSGQTPEKILFLGYNELLDEIVGEIDKYLLSNQKYPLLMKRKIIGILILI